MKKFGLGLVFLLLASACGGDDAGVSLSQRDAESSECPNGGLVISIDGQEQSTAPTVQMVPMERTE
jgi:hypothetical protein